MNELGSYFLDSPFGKNEECARLVIDDTNSPFVLSNITTVDVEYTFSCWIKSDEMGSVIVGDTTFVTSPEWKRCVVTFTATLPVFTIDFISSGTYYIYHPQLEMGNIASDWSPSPDDMATSQELDLVKGTIKSTQTLMSELAVATEGISANVTRIEQETITSIEGISSELASLSEEVSLKISPEDVSITIKQELANGTSKVVTSAGYTFDDVGLTVAKSDSEMKTQITDDGMTVYQNEDPVLKANNAGVDAKNLRATTYLIVGKNSRFEDYGNRTGCFWIGE